MHNFVENYVTSLGFTKEAAEIYVALCKSGESTLLELSRATKIERTYLYRILPELIERGLLREVIKKKSKMVAAATPEQIELMVREQVNKSEELAMGYGEFEKLVSKTPTIPKTAVRYYSGAAGIKQILWNELKAKGDLLSYSYRNLEEPVGIPFFKKWVAELGRKKIVSRDIRGDTFLKSTKEPTHEHVHIGGSEWRYLPDAKLTLTHNMDIYNNTVAIYYWQNQELVGIEIENEDVAKTQRGIWKNMWGLAKPI